jgi:hypothetical protein
MRLGVVGTMVWDTIFGRGTDSVPVEEWGGIAYALAALEASLPPQWEIVPLIKVGRDMAPQANVFLNALSKRTGAARFVEVPESNNRVTLHYTTATRRTERLSGGVPPWTWTELGPMVRDLDVIYVNFISGFEFDLDVAEHLRRGFPGPIYADLHSLLLGVHCDGTRAPRPLPKVSDWFSCFDVVQLNDDELALIGGEPMAVAAEALAQGVRLLVITLGARGAVYFTASPFKLFRHEEETLEPTPVRTARIPAADVAEARDPTGCGDVFGATLVAQLIAELHVEDAIRKANAYAARNVQYQGATKLQYYLRGEIVPQ